MLPNKPKWVAVIGTGLAFAGLVLGQSADNQALINALIKKGVLTDKEAKDITAEVAKAQAAEDVETNGDQFIRKVTVGGRWQVQYVGLGTDVS